MNLSKIDKSIIFPIVGLIVALGFGFHYLGDTIAYNLSHRFWRAGVWGIVGPLAGIYCFYRAYKESEDITNNGTATNKLIALGYALILIGLFAPSAILKSDRSSGIPDVQIYYGNGKVLNATDSTKDNYYFKTIPVHGIDSEYIVKYSEEPGYNKTNSLVRFDTTLKSQAPRANEDWTRPAPIETQKLDGKY